MITIIEIGYAAIALLALRPLVGHIAWWFYEWDIAAPSVTDAERRRYWERVPSPQRFVWFMAFIAAILAAAIWPILIASKALSMPLRILNHKIPKMGAEKRAELRKREEYIKELEKECGL